MSKVLDKQLLLKIHQQDSPPVLNFKAVSGSKLAVSILRLSSKKKFSHFETRGKKLMLHTLMYERPLIQYGSTKRASGAPFGR